MGIGATVAMPVWDSRKIAWLPMEGLCRQNRPSFDWELVVCEERHKGQCGKEFFEGYRERLEKAGCVEIRYIELGYWIPPGLKWYYMGRNISPDSRVFLLQGADDYSHPERLEVSCRHIKEGYDWYDIKSYYFYHVLRQRVMLYDKPSPESTHINIAFKADAARNIPYNDIRKCVDSYLHRHCRDYSGGVLRKYTDVKDTYAGIATDGFNHITKVRDKRYVRPKPPFYKTDKTLRDIGLPEKVVAKLEKMK